MLTTKKRVFQAGGAVCTKARQKRSRLSSGNYDGVSGGEEVGTRLEEKPSYVLRRHKTEPCNYSRFRDLSTVNLSHFTSIRRMIYILPIFFPTC